MSTLVYDDVSRSMLAQMKKGGFDFAGFYPIEFYAVFPDRKAALQAARQFCGESLNAQVMEGVDGWWNLQLSKVMAATQDGIDAFEGTLRSIAEPLGGVTQGWGVEQEVLESALAVPQVLN